MVSIQLHEVHPLGCHVHKVDTGSNNQEDKRELQPRLPRWDDLICCPHQPNAEQIQTSVYEWQ